MGMPAYAVLIFEEAGLFLARVLCGKVGVDPALAALHAAAAVYGVVDLILGDEACQLRHGGHFGGIFSAWQGHIPQALLDFVRLVVMEAQQAHLPPVVGSELCKIVHEDFAERRVCHPLGKPRRFLRETAAPHIRQAGEVALRRRFIAEVVPEIPDRLRQLRAFMPRRFRKLHIGGIRAAVHKLGNARGGALPCNYLRTAHIFRTSAGGDVDAVSGIPRGKLALRGFEAVAAVEGVLQQRGNVFRGLLFLERCGDHHAGIVLVAAQPQHMVKLLLRNGKSEGRLCALRFFYGCNLFRFGGEKG